tara:strand:- start:541 stop:1560 length:1020 start_codon:yes stop_codon:yes gene_type:complete
MEKFNDLTKFLRIDYLLDEGMRNIWIDEKKTILSLSQDKLKIDGDFEATGTFTAPNYSPSFTDLSISGDLTVGGGKITFGNGELIHNETDNQLLFQTSTFLLDSTTNDTNATFALFAEIGYDPQLAFYESAACRWTIGSDQTDSHTMKWDVSAITGGATKMSLTSSGALTVADDVFDDGNAPTEDAQLTNKAYVDGRIAAEPYIRKAEVTLSTSDMNSLHSTAITILAAQGANQVIVPISCSLFIDRSDLTSQSASGADLFVSYNGTTIADAVIFYKRRWMYLETGDRIHHMQGDYSYSGTTLTAGDNQPVTIKLDSAITSSSIESMKVVMAYWVYDNS